MERDELVEVGFFESRLEAEFAQSALKQEGIESVLKGDDPYAVPGSGTGDFELLVHARDEDKALDVLDSIGADTAAEKELPEPFDGRKSSFPAFFLFALLIGLGCAAMFFLWSSMAGNSGSKAPGSSPRTVVQDGADPGAAAFDIQQEEVLKGKLLEFTEEKDLDGDGFNETVTFFNNGVAAVTEVREKGGKGPRAVITFTNGVRAKETADTDGDGKFDRLVLYDRYGCFASTQEMVP